MFFQFTFPFLLVSEDLLEQKWVIASFNTTMKLESMMELCLEWTAQEQCNYTSELLYGSL